MWRQGEEGSVQGWGNYTGRSSTLSSTPSTLTNLTVGEEQERVRSPPPATPHSDTFHHRPWQTRFDAVTGPVPGGACPSLSISCPPSPPCW